MAKEAEEKIRVANSERDSAIKAFEEDRALAAMREKAVQEIGWIVNYQVRDDL